jgi:hypothetical protein
MGSNRKAMATGCWADSKITDADLAMLSREAATQGITLVELARTAASLEERYGSLVSGGVR